MGWLKRLYPLLGNAHASFFISHLIYFSSLSLSSPPPLAAGSLAVACFSLNLPECKLVCSDTGSKSTMAGIKLSNRMERFFWFWLPDIASYCGVRSWLRSEDGVKYHPERSVPWCSWNTELLLKYEGVWELSWPISSLSNATVTLIPRVLLLQYPLEEVI